MRAHYSTYLRLLVVLVLDAIDLLQQVADPVYLESKEASGYLPAPTQGLLSTTSKTPGLGPGSRHSWEFLSSPNPREWSHARSGQVAERNYYLPSPASSLGVGLGPRWSCPPEKALSQASHRPSNHTLGTLTVPNLEKKHDGLTHHQPYKHDQVQASPWPCSKVV